ncbi:MAG: histidinol dehydrogenase, partial [Crocinitomicaceae bacterium]|nr:histidinol dehydrogenase [Crocinitomicaceae bacterium]
MKTIINPKTSDWKILAKRPAIAVQEMDKLVDQIFNSVMEQGDKALIEFTQKFDKVKKTSLKLTSQEIKKQSQQISKDLKAAIDVAYKNISK